MKKEILKNDLEWYLTQSIPNPLNSYQMSKVNEYIKELKEKAWMYDDLNK